MASTASRSKASEVRTEAPDVVTRLVRGVLPVAIVLGTMLVFVRLAARPLGNTDTYFHLRFGAEFLDSWSLRDPGRLSSFESADWVPTQWLPQLVAARAEELGGLPAVAWLAGLQFVLLLLALYWGARRHAPALLAAVLLPLAVLALIPGLSMRPQVLSYALTAVWVSAWLRARQTGRPPWLLVPLTWLWAVCHGMWPVGVVIGLAAVAGLALDRVTAGRQTLRMAAVPLGGLLLGGLTPTGPDLYGAVLTVTGRGRYFSEWSAPDFTSLSPAALLVLLALAALALLRTAPARWFDISLLATAAALAVYSMRTVPVAAALLVPLTATALARALKVEREPVRRAEVVTVAGGAVVALVGLALAVPHTSADPAPGLRAADAPLRDVPAGSVVLSDAALGGYLMWRFPDLRLTSHGYGDVYTDAELERNADIKALAPGWDEEVAGLSADYAVLRPDSELAYAVEELLGWHVLHEDDDVVVLRPPAATIQR